MSPATILKVVLIAEQVLIEPSRRAQINGFLGVSPWAVIGIPDPKRPIPSLAFMCLSGEPIQAGQYTIDLRIHDPNGASLVEPAFTQVLTAERQAPLAAIFQIGIFPLRGIGTYELHFLINGNPDLVGAFTITQGPSSSIR